MRTQLLFSGFVATLIISGPCSAGFIGPPPANELPPIPTEQIHGHIDANNGFNWNYNYGIGYTGSALRVDVEISFTGVVTNALRNLWEQGIESLWNGRFFVVKDERYSIPITLDVTTAGPPNYTVNVVPGPHTSTMTEWDTEDTGNVAAHEFGHMLGLFDEYAAGATNPAGRIIDLTSIMGSTAGGSRPYARHFAGFESWLASKSPDEEFRLQATPEPSTVLLTALGLFFALHRLRTARCN